MMMPKPSLFAGEDRGIRLSKLGYPLVGESKHVDFAELADEIDIALTRTSRANGGRPRRAAQFGNGQNKHLSFESHTLGAQAPCSIPRKNKKSPEGDCFFVYWRKRCLSNSPMRK